ncbi:MAG TPA: alpha/beta fold hydrolase [Anaerolineales bacterium]|nr:alpha/beta fold hydrolase [Anaerolineales bacterium]
MPVSGNLYYSQHCERETETPPLVLIHGAGGTHLYWPPEIRRLRGYCVYAIDLPGHGKSSTSDGQQSIGEYARFLVQWLESLQLRRAVLIGHSMGSAIALALAVHHPEYVVGLGLLGAGARLRVLPELLAYIADQTTFYKATDLLVTCSFSANAPAHLVELAAKRLLETRQSVLYGDLIACDRFDMMDQLKNVRQPTQVICGEEDQLTPLRFAQFLANSIPNARLSVIPDAGHMVMLEKPDLVVESLHSFLQDITFHPGEGL